MCVLPAAPSQTSQDSESANASVQQRYVVNHAAVLSLHNALLSESRIRQLSDGGATKKWHEEFVRILEMPDNEKKFSLLRNLGQDFVYTAEVCLLTRIMDLIAVETSTYNPSDVRQNYHLGNAPATLRKNHKAC